MIHHSGGFISLFISPMFMRHFLKVVLLLSVIIGCRSSTPCEKEIYLIPQGLYGVVMVFFDQPDGQPVQYENNARVYHIPSSGLLKSQFPRNGGCMNNNRINFFYEDSTGARKPLVYFMNINRKDRPKDSDYVMMTFFSDKKKKPDFLIHLIGRSYEFKELSKKVINIDPEKILKSIK
jgi:hypothetical protein